MSETHKWWQDWQTGKVLKKEKTKSKQTQHNTKKMPLKAPVNMSEQTNGFERSEIEYVASAIVTCPPKQAPIHKHQYRHKKLDKVSKRVHIRNMISNWLNHRSAQKIDFRDRLPSILWSINLAYISNWVAGKLAASLLFSEKKKTAHLEAAKEKIWYEAFYLVCSLAHFEIKPVYKYSGSFRLNFSGTSLKLQHKTAKRGH